MSQWFFLMESLSELDGGLTGRLGATLHTTGPCVFGKETPPPEDPMELRGRSDLKGELSRSLMGPTSALISIGRTSWLSAFRLVWKHLRRSRIPGQKRTRMKKKRASARLKLIGYPLESWTQTGFFFFFFFCWTYRFLMQTNNATRRRSPSTLALISIISM